MRIKGSIREAGEEIPDDKRKRFEAAVDFAVKSGPKQRPSGKQDKKGAQNVGQRVTR